MTKRQIVDKLEQSNKIIDFDRNFLMRKSKDRLMNLYNSIYHIVPKK